MAEKIEDNLLQAIKKDDIKAFDAMMDKTQCGAYRLGRFPVLSLLYLYKARKILASYEGTFIKVNGYVALPEPIEISGKFSARAGKCLRLYFNEVVSPLEMLLILNNVKRLKQVYPNMTVSSAVKDRLKSIYYIRYGLNVRFDGNTILFDKRPLSAREKRNLATVCICIALAIVLLVVTPITAVALIPKPLGGLDLSANQEYTLDKDLVVPKNYYVAEVNCTIIGGGHKLIFRNGARFGKLNGKLSDLTIESNGNAIIESINEKATVENVTLEVNANISSGSATAFLALNNYGSINNVTVNAKGKIKALAPSSGETNSDNAFGGIVQTNGNAYGVGTISNCTVNYTQLSLSGVGSANASFGGVVGINIGAVKDCKVSGEIVGDTFDIAGICSTNSGLLSGNVNEAKLSQTSSDTGWNPIVCGIVLTNAYAVENCQNKGSITSTSTCGEFETQEGYESVVSAAGIAYISRGSRTNSYIYNCVNSGNIESGAKYRNAYAAGVCLSSNGAIDSCKNSGAVTAKSDNDCDVYVGGIAVIAYGDISKSSNMGAVSATGKDEAQVGGIAARLCAQVDNCISSGDISVEAKTVYAGGLIGFSETIISGYYVYFGIVDFCISQGKIDVKTTGDKPARVGGIVGYVQELGVEGGETMRYFGGRVANCYFTGECVTEVTYFGNIVGVCGANIFESNTFASGDAEYANFEGNFYLDNSSTAFGATVTDDDTFALAEDKGAKAATLEEIQNSQSYQSILSAIK